PSGTGGGSDTTTPPATTPPPTTTDVPTAVLISAPAVTAIGSNERIQVTYADTDGVQVNSFGNGDVTVTGPNGYSQAASFIGADKTYNGTPRTATYAVAAPGGSWDSWDSCSYNVNLNTNGVRDATGIYAPAQTLGSFNVNI